MLLNEGSYDTGESKDNVAYHIKELLDAGAIELARVEPVVIWIGSTSTPLSDAPYRSVSIRGPQREASG
jgi:DNA-binding transcriptional ArsR family regulator